MIRYIFFLFISFSLFSQSINLNNDYLNRYINNYTLMGEINTSYSNTIRPISFKKISDENPNFDLDFFRKRIFRAKNKFIEFDLLPINYLTEFNSANPYKRNNGSMVPNSGFQHIFSMGFYLKLGPLSIQLNPEHHYSDNKNFDGFWDGHYPEIWKKRYQLWNYIDLPERHGEKRHNKLLSGQSSVRLNWKNLSLGISSENIWWGPSKRNSIMMSNNARGFNHITFNSLYPLKTKIGNFEWQLLTGRLERSGFTPPRTDYMYAGSYLYRPKLNQRGEEDWRYFQGLIITYSPKWIDGLSLGFIRWVQMYSALVEGKYPWLKGSPTYFPIFKNLFRKNDIYENYEDQTDQAAGVFLKWFWKESKSEIYAEFYNGDAKQNFRDLLLDANHSRAITAGLQKVFNLGNSNYIFNWEWTQMEQSASRLIRNAGSWYAHSYVYDGYTNYGEVLGSRIGPGSNSHYFSLNKINKNKTLGIAFEMISNDNDFYYEAFSSAQDYRRYWKDFNLHINFDQKFKSFWISANFVFIRSLNYQWEIDDYAEPYYHPGKDVNSFSSYINFSYFF